MLREELLQPAPRVLGGGLLVRRAFVPLDNVERLKAEAARRGKTVEIVVYPGAGHGFFCSERASYQKTAAEDAWARLKKFFAKHLQA